MNFYILKSGYDNKLSFINIYKATTVATCLLPSVFGYKIVATKVHLVT